MKTFRRVRCRALPSAACCVLAVCCALWSSSARAQQASLDPEPPLLPPPASPTVDRAGTNDRAGSHMRRQDHFSLGALGGVGFPRPLAIEGAVKLERTVLLGAEYSVLPRISTSSVTVSYWAVAGDARVFPLRGPFFVGLRAGQQHLSAEASLSAYGYTVPAAASVDTTFLNPRLGFLWTWDPGFTLGIDAGVQVPLSSSASSTLPTSTNSAIVASGVASVQHTLNDVANTIGQTTLPTVDLVQVGILF